MSQSDSSEEHLTGAFRARLEAAPAPPETMFARTMAAVRAPSAKKATWRSATGWWSALAAPARFATAAAIVIIGGTIAFGTVKATRERIVATDTARASRITLDPPAVADVHFARTGSLTLGVRDIASTTRHIGEVVHRERGELASQNGGRASGDTASTTRLVVRVRSNRLDAVMDAIGKLGRVESRTIATADLTRSLDDTSRALRNALTAAHALRSAAQVPGSIAAAPVLDANANKAEIARLNSRRELLERRIATATLAIVLRATDPNRTALAAERMARELSPSVKRRTGNQLARGSRFGTLGTDVARYRFRPFDHLASRAFADRTSTVGRTSAGRNAAPDRA